MNARNPAFVAFVICIMESVASADESRWPTSSASDFSVFVTLERFRIYADQCSGSVPGLKPKFDSLMESLGSRIQGISQSLLSTDAFGGMKRKAVPAAISFAFEDSLEDASHNFERQDAVSICPKKLHSLGQIDDESLRSDLTQTFMAVQSMIQNLERERDRETVPGERRQVSGSP